MLQQRFQFGAKNGTTKWIELHNKKIRLFLIKQGINDLPTSMLNLVDALIGISGNQTGKLFIHVQHRQAHKPNVIRQIYFNLLPAGDQRYVMVCERPCKLQTAYQVAHPPNILAIKNNVHKKNFIKSLQGQVKAGEFSLPALKIKLALYF